MTAAGAAYTAMGLIILACIAIGYAITRDSSEKSSLLLRARWAWRCRGHPPLPGHETIREPERS